LHQSKEGQDGNDFARKIKQRLKRRAMSLPSLSFENSTARAMSLPSCPFESSPSKERDGNDIAVEPSKEKRWQRHCRGAPKRIMSFRGADLVYVSKKASDPLRKCIFKGKQRNLRKCRGQKFRSHLKKPKVNKLPGPKILFPLKKRKGKKLPYGVS